MPAPLAPARRRLLNMRRSTLLSALVLLVYASVASAVEICNQVTTCRRNGGADCDRSKETCPPCIYTLQDKFTCWEKDNVTNTCPFTGVKYDCSTVWASTSGSMNSTSSNGTTTSGAATTTAKNSMVMYAAIGGGVLLLLIVIIFFLIRRRRRGRNMPKFVMSDSPPTAFNTKRGAKAATANTPYANVLETSKGGAQPYNYQRKMSDPALLESSAVRAAPSNYSGNTTSDSLDGMLVDNTPPTAVLGDPIHRTRSKRALSKGFSRLNSGGSRRESAKFAEKIDLAARYTNSNNLLGEYLKTKQEMKFDADAVTDYGSDTMSLDRFSVESGSTIAGGGGARAMSITDSEYNAELMRSRTESECYSEMSYNDEKYSFSEEDPESMLSASVVGKPNKEIEI